MNQLYAMGHDLIAWAYAAAQQNLRRIERPGGQDNFFAGRKGSALAPNQHINGNRPSSLKTHGIGTGVRQNGEIGAMTYGMQVGSCSATALGPFHRVFVARKALLLTPIKIVRQWEPSLGPSLNKPIQQNIVCPVRTFDGQRAVIAVITLITRALKRLCAFEVR